MKTMKTRTLRQSTIDETVRRLGTVAAALVLGLLFGGPVAAQEAESAPPTEEATPAGGESPSGPAAADDATVRQRLDEALLRYRNLAATSKAAEREWLEGTATLIRRVEERLRPEAPPAATGTTPVAVRPVATPTAPRPAAAPLPVAAATNLRVVGRPACVPAAPVAAPAPVAAAPRVPVIPPAETAPPPKEDEVLLRARQLEAMAGDLLDVASKLRAASAAAPKN